MKKNMQNGITLVALVITIILLLILAAISIQALTNQGLFSQAQNAKTASEIANIKEQIQLDIYEKQLEPPLGDITEEQLKTILGKYGTISYEEDGITIKGITTEKEYEILLKDIYGGETVAESVPDGAIVNPVNDITTWLKTAGISEQYSYTTIEEVITDSACTESLMKNENAMKYLARSTEFTNAICASETAMRYLGKSAYVDDTVLNSDIWLSKIPMSPYWDKVSNIAVTLHGGASETITITGLYGSPTVTTNSDGNVSYYLPLGTFTFSGAISGQAFTRTVTNDTTEVYVMPEGALYWYGNECIWITGGFTLTTVNDYTKKSTNQMSINDYGNNIYLYSNNKIAVNSDRKLVIYWGLSGNDYNYNGSNTNQSFCGFSQTTNTSAFDIYVTDTQAGAWNIVWRSSSLNITSAQNGYLKIYIKTLNGVDNTGCYIKSIHIE